MTAADLLIWHNRNVAVHRHAMHRYAALANGDANRSYNEPKRKYHAKWTAFHENAAQCIHSMMQSNRSAWEEGHSAGYHQGSLDEHRNNP